MCRIFRRLLHVNHVVGGFSAPIPRCFSCPFRVRRRPLMSAPCVAILINNELKIGFSILRVSRHNRCQFVYLAGWQVGLSLSEDLNKCIAMKFWARLLSPVIFEITKHNSPPRTASSWSTTRWRNRSSRHQRWCARDANHCGHSVVIEYVVNTRQPMHRFQLREQQCIGHIGDYRCYCAPLYFFLIGTVHLRRRSPPLEEHISKATGYPVKQIQCDSVQLRNDFIKLYWFRHWNVWWWLQNLIIWSVNMFISLLRNKYMYSVDSFRVHRLELIIILDHECRQW